jgi:1-deoxy-D-xylulose-5-phosphate synthase
MHKAIYEDKGLVAVRYPRGGEQADFDTSQSSTEYLLERVEKTDTLIVTYGRVYNEVCKAQKLLSADGIECDMLRMTKIFPVCPEIIGEMKSYSRVVFFEESFGEGSISEKIGDMLAESGYEGSYSRVTADGFIKQACVDDCLASIGLTADRMAEFIRREYGKA